MKAVSCSRWGLILGVTAGLMTAADNAPAPKIAVIEEIIAKVNGDIVTKSEVHRTIRQMQAEAEKRGGADKPEIRSMLEDRMQHALRDRIDQLLLVQKAKDLSINVEADVNRYIADLQKRVKVADPEEFAVIIRQETGQTFEDYKNELRNSILTQRVIGQDVRRSINVPREELQKYYNEHQAEYVRKDTIYLRELLVAASRPDAEKRAKDLAERAKKGERFTDLVRDNSDADTARDEGELPPFEKGQLDPALEVLVWEQDKGFVTDPVRRQSGWLILRVEEHLRPGQATFEEVENRIADQLAAPKMETAVREYLTKLRQDAFLEIKRGYLDTGAAPGKDTTWTDPAQLRPETISKSELSEFRRRKLLFVPIPGTKVRIKEAPRDPNQESKSKLVTPK
jgi:parvulin-like peptidyl-prolyl isomerase